MTEIRACLRLSRTGTLVSQSCYVRALLTEYLDH